MEAEAQEQAAGQGPKCDRCGAGKFETEIVGWSKATIVYCTGCGHIVGALSGHAEVAKAIVMALTRGSKDGGAHPVLRVTTADMVFG